MKNKIIPSIIEVHDHATDSQIKILQKINKNSIIVRSSLLKSELKNINQKNNNLTLEEQLRIFSDTYTKK